MCVNIMFDPNVLDGKKIACVMINYMIIMTMSFFLLCVSLPHLIPLNLCFQVCMWCSV